VGLASLGQFVYNSAWRSKALRDCEAVVAPPLMASAQLLPDVFRVRSFPLAGKRQRKRRALAQSVAVYAQRPAHFLRRQHPL